MDDPGAAFAERIRLELEQLDERREKLIHALEVIEELDRGGSMQGVNPQILAAGGRLGANGNDPLDNNDLSLRDAARIVMVQKGRPLSVPELATHLRDSSFPYEKDEETLRRSLSGVLGRWVRKGEKFFRPETGKYAPIEWKGKDDEQLSIDE